MKKINLLLTISLVGLVNLLSAQSGTQTQTGILDNSFGDNGIVTTPIGPGGSQIWGMAIQSDWSIVVGGFASNGQNLDFAVAKYNANGTLDSSFGTNGMTTTAIGDSNDLAFALALQQDGKIVLGGFAWINGNYDFALARYNTDGSIDASFGNNGKVTTPIGPGNDKGYSIAIQSDWSIVLGGSSFNGTNYDFTMARYKTSGTLDSTFGTNGIATTPMGTGNSTIYSMAIQSGWSIVVGGIAANGAHQNFALARYDLTGALVNNFGTNGKVLTAMSDGDNGAYAIVLQPDGKIVSTGFAYGSAANQFALARYDSTGVLDANFGTGGEVTTPIGDSADALYSVFIQPDGKIVGAGSIYNGTKENYGMTRYNTDGSLDNNFGTSGKVITVMSPGNNESYAVNMQPDGKIISSGYANDGTNDNFSVARYISGLTLGVLDFTSSQNLALIYPNPITQNATLEYTLQSKEELSIKLVDMQGRTVETFVNNQIHEAGDYKQPITLSQGVASGSYLIVISSANGNNISIKITK